MRVHKLLPHGMDGNAPDTVVVHAMSENIVTKDGVVPAYDYLYENGLSAHSLVYPDGTNVRCRNDNQVAWHAKGFNRDSLGIEILVPGAHTYASFVEAIHGDWVTKSAYDIAVYQVREWMEIHGIHTIVRHSDISPGRKVDPGAGFPWEEFLHDIRQ